MIYFNLSDCAIYGEDRVNVSYLSKNNYISTENMLPDRRGICPATSLPNIRSVTKFVSGDILLSNIRPYFKKIWLAEYNGGCSNDVLVIRAKNGTDPHFLYYVLSDTNFFNYATATAKGTKMPRGSKAAIMKYLISAFDLPTQEKIASILSAYDDAVENNNKRIKILEKMAEDLYREWFIRMRFPGHKTAEYENGLPKGWKRGRLEDAIEVDPIVKIPKGEKIKSVPMAALSTSQMCIDENEISCSTTATGSRFSNGDVLLAKITPCLENGKTGFVNLLKENEYGCGSTEFIVLRARTLSPYFVYFLARSQYFRGIAIGSMNGADGRQRASVSKIKQIKLICPTQDLVNKFSEVSKPFFDAIFKLSAMNHKLVKQRNRLLPHLLSGNLEIKI